MPNIIDNDLFIMRVCKVSAIEQKIHDHSLPILTSEKHIQIYMYLLNKVPVLYTPNSSTWKQNMLLSYHTFVLL